MLLYCIKYFFIIVCSFFIFKKLLNIPMKARQAGLDALLSAALAVGLYGMYQHFYGAVFITVVLFCAAASLLYKQKHRVAFVTGALSFGLAYAISFPATVISAAALYLILSLIRNSGSGFDYQSYSQEIYRIMSLAAGVFQMIISTLPFRFSRLKRGMPYLQQDKAGTFGTIVSLILLLVCSFATSPLGQEIGISTYYVVIAEAGMILILWWRAKIIARFKERMRQKQMADNAEELRQAMERIAVLERDNERMAKIIHADNKSIPAMGAAVMKTLQTAVFPSVEDRQEALDLLQQLNDTAQSRAKLFFVYRNSERNFPQTGVPGVDIMIRHMGQRAYEAGIHFDFGFSGSVKYMTQTEIMEQDLVNIIGDLVENAIIAERESPLKNILLYISIVEQKYRLEISDSGAPFEPGTIARLGKQRFTTHADTGGSGYGMVTLFEILRKYGASFVLEEYSPGGPFTKKISLCFDDMSQFRLITDRQEVLALEIGRDDVLRAEA